MKELIRFADTLQEALRLPVHILNRENCCINNRASGEETPFLYDQKLTALLLQSGNALCPDLEFESIYYGVAGIDKEHCIVIGPCSTLPLEEETRYAYLTMHGMTDFQNFSIPVAPPRRLKAALLLTLDRWAESDDIKDLVSEQSPSSGEAVPAENLMKEALRNAESEKHHHSYRLERQIMQLLKEGNEEAIISILSDGDYNELGVMSRSAQKQSEYLAVLFVSLMVRAAIQANVDPYRAYAFNDLYLQKISESKHPKQYRQIMQTAVHQLIDEIQMVRNRQRALPHVERAKQVIRSNLNREMSLAEISTAVGISPNYLSAIFKKHEDMTIKEFILRERVEAAKIILRETNLPISQVAAYLHFSSHSHLSCAFKTLTGETPTEYRNRNQIIQENNER